MDGSGKHYEKQKKPDPNKWILYDSADIQEWAKLTYGGRNQDIGGLCRVGVDLTFWGHGNVLYTFVKTHPIILWRSV